MTVVPPTSIRERSIKKLSLSFLISFFLCLVIIFSLHIVLSVFTCRLGRCYTMHLSTFVFMFLPLEQCKQKFLALFEESATDDRYSKTVTLPVFQLSWDKEAPRKPVLVHIET